MWMLSFQQYPLTDGGKITVPLQKPQLNFVDNSLVNILSSLPTLISSNVSDVLQQPQTTLLTVVDRISCDNLQFSPQPVTLS